MVLGVFGVLGVWRGLEGSPLLPATRASGMAAATGGGGGAGAPGSAESSPAGERSSTAGDANTTTPEATPGVVRTINVNTATAAELDLLPGIGPARAADIIADRAANGPYTSLDDLDRVPGIGAKTIAKLAPYASAE